MSPSGAIKTYGKWILAGEHAVLRGAPALAFPLLSRSLELDFAPGDKFEVAYAGPHGGEYKLLFPSVLESALDRLHHRTAPRGRFRLTSSLPVGTGLGASAALCGAVARWCGAMGWLETSRHYDFARGLEDLFHGESSGLDVAVSLGGRGVRFVRGEPFVTVRPRWWPKIYLSYSGQRGVTSECVTQVKKLFVTDPQRARALDQDMIRAVEGAERALGEDDGFETFRHALHLALGCFEGWGLCPPGVKHHFARLTAAGAVAVKPTGSGGGGFVLSLWREDPPASLRRELIAAESPPRLGSD